MRTDRWPKVSRKGAKAQRQKRILGKYSSLCVFAPLRDTPRRFTPGLALLAVLSLAARGVPDDAPRPPLDPGVTSVRLLLGVGDRQPQTWSGRVTVDKGEVVGVEGWRFRAGDSVTGKDAWEAKSLLIRKPAAGKKAAPKPAAVRKATS